jgi:hypothetical protein
MGEGQDLGRWTLVNVVNDLMGRYGWEIGRGGTWKLFR